MQYICSSGLVQYGSATAAVGTAVLLRRDTDHQTGEGSRQPSLLIKDMGTCFNITLLLKSLGVNINILLKNRKTC